MEPFVKGFIETALWSSTVTVDNPDGGPGATRDIGCGAYSLDRGSMGALEAVARQWWEKHGELVSDAVEDGYPIRRHDQCAYECAGHDLWLTASGHGAGFWDGDWEGYSDRLTESAQELSWIERSYFYLSEDDPDTVIWDGYQGRI